MIVSKDINPVRDVYYLGARIIEILSSNPNMTDFLDIYKNLNTTKKVSMNLYSLTLDWLYIIGVIENSTAGTIKKCF